MSTLPPEDPIEVIGWIANEIAEENRRSRNRRRKGKIVEENADDGLYRVRFREPEGDEPAFDSPWLPVKAISAGGVRIQIEPTIGQWCEVVSENGEITDGWIEMSDYHENRKRPHNKNGEIATDVSDGAYRAVIDIKGAETTKAVSRVHNTDGNVNFNTGGIVRFN